MPESSSQACNVVHPGPKSESAHPMPQDSIPLNSERGHSKINGQKLFVFTLEGALTPGESGTLPGLT